QRRYGFGSVKISRHCSTCQNPGRPQHRQPTGGEAGRCRAAWRGSAAVPMLGLYLVLASSEKPPANMIGDSPQPGIVDPFNVVRGHALADVAHDPVDGW